MDTLIDPAAGDYAGERTDTLANAVYLRLMTPLGSWWADALVGSRLHELQREKDVPRVALLAQQYAEQALAPLLRDARARAIVVSTTRQAGRLLLHIAVTEAGGTVRQFVHPVRVA
ncbi:phage GP46 family protein [Chitiniphilus eburneus]|uniref:phage GP46 family protein n=1 Tax=Chitiniphilus eburneus TaxID=2571148 RepID=UPI0035CFF731